MTEPHAIVCLGLDGRTAPVADREAWALTPDDAGALYTAARADGFGACLVSTCYRVELLVAGPEPASALLAWGRRQLAALRPDAGLGAFVDRTGEVALRHVVRVAAGLESAVLGEAQILGQVRRARADAAQAGVLSPALRHVLAAAVRTGQRVRRTTHLGRGAASTASAAIHLAEEGRTGLGGRHVLVVGGGQMGRLLMGLLPATRPASVTLVSAHVPPHEGFTVVRPDALAAVLPEADVVFTAAAQTAFTLDEAHAAWADGRARTVVDLGVPRNVPAEIGQIAGVALHDIDALGAVVDAGLQAREAAVPAAEAKVDAALDGLRADLDGLRREALVADVRRQAEQVRRETVAYVCGRCDDRTCEPASGRVPRCSDPETLTRTLTTRLFHDLTASLRERTDDLDEGTLRRLFALDRTDG